MKSLYGRILTDYVRNLNGVKDNLIQVLLILCYNGWMTLCHLGEIISVVNFLLCQVNGLAASVEAADQILAKWPFCARAQCSLI